MAAALLPGLLLPLAKARSPVVLAPWCSTISRARPGSLSGWMAVAQAWAVTNLRLPGIPTAGPIIAFTAPLDDRQSGWADNNPSSPFYGNLYVSWNDFSQPNANIFCSFSTDNGATWHSPVLVSTQNSFIRNVQ